MAPVETFATVEVNPTLRFLPIITPSTSMASHVLKMAHRLCGSSNPSNINNSGCFPLGIASIISSIEEYPYPSV